MFNLARKKVPEYLAQEDAIFRSKPFAQKLQEDSMSLAQTMVTHGLEPEDAFELRSSGVEYWEYVSMFHPHYKQKVFQRAKEMSEQFRHQWDNHPEQFPMPSPKQPGGGMGGTAATDKKSVYAEIKTVVLPDGKLLIRQGPTYSIRLKDETLYFSANENEAIKVAMEKLSSRDMARINGKVIEG